MRNSSRPRLRRNQSVSYLFLYWPFTLVFLIDNNSETRIIHNMNLKQRILALAQKAVRIHDERITDFEEAWEVVQKEMETELAAIDKAAGKGLAVGRTLTYGVADGNATYVITKIRKNDVVVEWVPLYDGYFSNAVWLTSDRRHYIVNRQDAERQCQFADTINYHGR